LSDGIDRRPVRLFLDAGVIVEGCLGVWGAAKALLILATMRTRYTVVLAEAVEREVQRTFARKTAGLDAAAAAAIMQDLVGWLARIRIERHPSPTDALLREHAPTVLPALRHVNDLLAVVTAMQAQPDWVISTNTAHWTPDLAARTGLRIVTPQEFLAELRLR
jgi:hypothetical protein